MKLRSIAVPTILAMLCAASVSAVAASGQAKADNSTVQTVSEKASAGEPVVRLPESKYAFEAVVDGTQVTHDFTIRNAGNGILTIDEVKTG